MTSTDYRKTGLAQKRLSVAPMMEWTDRHCRYFHRLLAPNAVLYTEMIPTGAILRGDWERYLRFHPDEMPLVLQVGGSNPEELAECAVRACEAGFKEININCGCPSKRVKSGLFGAILMETPEKVAKAVGLMKKSANIEVTVKCRTAVDDVEEEPFLRKFIEIVAAEGCKRFIIHARKAWLNGLSPKENRDIPPLNYPLVLHMKESFPNLIIELNGGLKTIGDLDYALTHFDGAMIGRQAYQNPWLLREAELHFHGIQEGLPDSRQIVNSMAQYANEEYRLWGTPVKTVAKHMTGLFHGKPGARRWRQELSPLNQLDNHTSPEKPGEILSAAYNRIWDALA